VATTMTYTSRFDQLTDIVRVTNVYVVWYGIVLFAIIALDR